MGEAPASVIVRAFAGLEDRKSPATVDQMAMVVAKSSRHFPQELIDMYCQHGWGTGWIPPLPEDDNPEEEDGSGYCFVRIHSPEEMLHTDWDQFSEEYCIFGSDGSGGLLVHHREKGYGLLEMIGEEFFPVAKTLEGFFEATEKDAWFDD